MYPRVAFLITLFVLLSASGSAQEINWMSFEEAVAKSQKEPKKLLIDIYTDWCGWCKKMDKDTYANKALAAYINENYYAVRFNAEQKESIEFSGHTFKFVAQGRRGVHELAAALTNNKLSYPMTVFMDEEFLILQAIPGYKTPDAFEPILVYFGDNAFKDTAWTEFQKNYQSFL